MTEAQHTPSLWRAIPWTRRAATTVVVDDPAAMTGKRVIAECESEEVARLLAAAPELLERLEELLEYSENLRGSAVYKRVQEVIAKATGGTP